MSKIGFPNHTYLRSSVLFLIFDLVLSPFLKISLMYYNSSENNCVFHKGQEHQQHTGPQMIWNNITKASIKAGNEILKPPSKQKQSLDEEEIVKVSKEEIKQILKAKILRIYRQIHLDSYLETFKF